MEHKAGDITTEERELLQRLRQKPPIYLGEYSLPRLRSFLDGWYMALAAHGLEAGLLPEGFDDFVLKRLGLYPSTMGWTRAILEFFPDGEAAIREFFRLLDEFLRENGFAGLS